MQGGGSDTGGVQVAPTPSLLGIQEIRPLNIRRSRSAQALHANGEASLHLPSTMGIPRSVSPGLSRASSASAIPGRPKPKLGLNFSGVKNAFSGGGYFDSADSLAEHDQDGMTEKPRGGPGDPYTLESLRATIEEIEQIQPTISLEDPSETPISPHPPVQPSPSPKLADPPAPPPRPPVSQLSSSSTYDAKWSDDVLEEISRLGEGASGAVHLVRDKRSQKVMARKTITTLEAPMKQLLRELHIISSNSHPHIVTFYGAYISPSSSEVKVLMEVCDGKSLEAVGKRLRERGAKVSEKVAASLAEGILSGLAYLHSRGVIHRDIKPANVLLTRKGVVRLCDFGVSGELVESKAGTFTGTSLYMAPERLQAKEYTIRSDVWSSGITLLELVENRYPFPPDLTVVELMTQIMKHAPPRLEGDWSDDMKDFIKQMLTSSPTERPTPEDMLRHPWLVNILSGPGKVPMGTWIRQVWGWPEPIKKSQSKSS